MSYRDLETETLKRRIAELVELRRELDAQLVVLTGMRGRRTATWFPRLVFGLLAALAPEGRVCAHRRLCAVRRSGRRVPHDG